MGTDARIFTAAITFKVLVLLLESKKKTAWLHWDSEKHSPEESSGFFDLGLFIWLARLFRTGFSSVLSMGNLYHLDENLSSEKMHQQLNVYFGRSASSGSKFRLAKALVRALIGPVLMPVLPRLILMGFTFSQPFFLASVLSMLAHGKKDGARTDGFGLIGAAAIIYTGIALSRAFYGYFSQRVVTMARGCLVSAVYAKTTELQSLARDDAAAITLMSTDIERVTAGMENMHDFWADVLQVGLGCWLLQRKLDSAFLAPMVVVLCCGLIMVWLGRASAKTQASWMAKIQSRVGMTSKVITHVKQVKISGIAPTIEELVQELRVNELLVGNKYRIVLVLTSMVSFAPQSLSAVLAFALAGSSLDVTATYESLAYLVLLTAPLSSFFQRIPNVLSAITCLTRIQEYLESKPRRDFRVASNEQTTRRLSSVSSFPSRMRSATASKLEQIDMTDACALSIEAALSISNGTFGWKAGQTVLTDISISLPISYFTFVIGPVASGKSSLCKAILGDIPIAAGEVRLHPSISSVAFCDQVPFLISGTLRQNIVGHLAFDHARFNEVVWTAALTEDISSLPNSYDTDIGTNGTTLSGGQKARVCLARALYDTSSLLVLDDVFSGLDNNTAARVFDRAFGTKGLLRRRGTTVLVCTHSMRHISLADHVLVLGPHGTIIEQGPFSSLKRSHDTASIFESSAEQFDSSVDVTKDESSTLRTARSRTEDAITKGLDDRSRQLGDWKVYKHYINSMNKLWLLLMITGCVIFAIGEHLPTVWVGLWAEDSLNQSRSFYLGIYGAVSSMIVIGVSVVAWTSFVPMTLDVGRELHRRALWTVMHAPLRLFTTTDTGTITNLFSQDTTIIDSELSMYLLNVVANTATIIGSGLVIALSSPYLAVSYPFLIAVGYCIQMFYLRTSRQLRLLDLEAKSPL